MDEDRDFLSFFLSFFLNPHCHSLLLYVNIPFLQAKEHGRKMKQANEKAVEYIMRMKYGMC